MSERLTAARLAEIEEMNALDMSTIQPGYHPGVIRDLLNELREVTRERDEVRDELREAYKSLVDASETIRSLSDEAESLTQERDKAVDAFNFANEHRVKAEKELADLEQERDKLKQQRDGLLADVVEMRRLVQQMEDLHQQELGDWDALRAENAKLKAVADAARPVCERYWQFDKSMKPEIEALQAALAALDPKEGA